MVKLIDAKLANILVKGKRYQKRYSESGIQACGPRELAKALLRPGVTFNQVLHTIDNRDRAIVTMASSREASK